MTVPTNFDNALKVLRARKPFRPFTIELVSGNRFEVDFPDALAVRDGVALPDPPASSMTLRFATKYWMHPIFTNNSQAI
jgi:hypothetical protein